MTGYLMCTAIVLTYDSNITRIIAACSKPQNERIALARYLAAEVIKLGKGKFNPKEVLRIVETDVVYGDTAALATKAKMAPREQPPVAQVQVQKAAKPAEIKHCYHSGDIGDIVFSLAGIMDIGGCYIHLGSDPASLRPCSPNTPRQPITKEIYSFIAPLLLAQPYVHGLEWSDKLDRTWYNFNLYRKKFVRGGFDLNLAVEQAKSMGADARCVYATWLFVPPGGPEGSDVIIARSPRYHTGCFPWKAVVAKYGKKLSFIGLDSEYERFCAEFGKVARIHVKNALELAQVISRCKLFVGNASAPQAIAEGLKKPIIMEWYSRHEHAHFARHNTAYHSETSDVILLPDLESDRGNVYHVVSRYVPTDKETIRRVKFAESTWELMYQDYGVVPVHVWAPPRNSAAIGDSRRVHYLKDVLQVGLNHARYDDDIIIFTNDDNAILPEIVPIIKQHMVQYGCCGSFRLEYKEHVSSISDLRNASPSYVTPLPSQGRDLFAFKKCWLAKHFVHIPDYLLGTNDWDYFLAMYMRIQLGISFTMQTMPNNELGVEIDTGYVWHEVHFPWASKIENKYTSPAQRHNKALTKKFIDDYGLKHITY